MIRQYLKIIVFLLLWLILNAMFNLFSVKLSGFIDAALFIILCHLCWILMIVFIGVEIRKSQQRPPGILIWLCGASYLVFIISYVLQVPAVSLFFSNRGGFFTNPFDFLNQYSTQLRSTMVMLVGSISACLVVMMISFSGIGVSSTDNPSQKEYQANRIAYLLIFCLFMAFYLSWAAVTRHDTFHSKAWDLAIFAQLIDNFRHGIFFEANVRGVSNIFSDHFTPIIYIFSPLLYAWNDPSRLLLVVQAVFITLGAIPVYLIAKLKTNSQTAGVAFGIAYLLLPTLQFMNLFDFHPVVIAIPLLLAAWYAWECRDYGWMYLLIFLSMMCQEEVWIIVGAMGLFLALFERERTHGIILTIIGWGGFIAMVLWFFPMFRSGGEYFYFHRYAYLGNNFVEIARNMAVHPLLWVPRLASPRAIMFAILMLLPVGFMALRRPKYLFILLPTYIYSALSVESLQTTMFAQYAAVYVPFIMIGAIYGVEALGKTKTSLEIASLAVVCAALVSNIFFSPLPHGYAYQESQLVGDFKSEKIKLALKMIPDEASVSAGSKFASHLVRCDLFLFPSCEKSDWVIFDLNDYHDPESGKTIRGILNQSDWKLTYSEDGVIVLNRGDNAGSNLQELKMRLLSMPIDLIKNSGVIAYYPPPGSKNDGNFPIYLRSISGTCRYDFMAAGHYEYVLYSGTFIRKKSVKNRYFGVIIYSSDMDDGMRFRKGLDFEVINFGMNLLEDDEWGEPPPESSRFYFGATENQDALIQWIHPPSFYSHGSCGFNSTCPIFLLYPYPDGYPNTLEEYFIEKYVKNPIDFGLKADSKHTDGFAEYLTVYIPSD